LWRATLALKYGKRCLWPQLHPRRDRGVRETGHTVELHFGYDVRDEKWLERLPYERQAEIEALRADPAQAKDLAASLLRDNRRRGG
jgi:hypothetical protein